jgi:predicted CopG family antitoxin
MSQTVIISDTLYARLEAAAQEHGLRSIEEVIEQLIEMWQVKADELRRRQEVVHRIDVLRERLFVTYGEMADSVELVRADRER